MTKKEKLDQAYKDLKSGLVLVYDTMASCYIDYSWRDGKEYIFWHGYGHSAKSVSKRNFKWILDEIFNVDDYLSYETR